MIPERVVELAAQEIDEFIGNALGVAENENMLDYPSVQDACADVARAVLEVVVPALIAEGWTEGAGRDA